MKEINDGKNYINVFSNINEFLKYLERPHKSGRDKSSQEKGDYSFYGTSSYEEAIKLIKNGDDELFEKIKEENAKIKINRDIGNRKNRLRYENGVYGFIPNVPNMMVGSPLTMINAKRDGVSKKIVNIFLNIRVSGFIDKDDIIRIGTKYLNVIDLLEKNGYRCNLYSGVANEKFDKHSCLMVRIKTDREPLNLKKICFAIANPSMQRRLKFKWMEVNDGPDFTNNGYGSIENEEYIRRLLEKELKEDMIIWNYEDRDLKAKSVEDITRDLKKYGIEINI